MHRWTKCSPHLFAVDLANPYLKPPEGLEEFKRQDQNYDEANISQKSKEMMEGLELKQKI